VSTNNALGTPKISASKAIVAATAAGPLRRRLPGGSLNLAAPVDRPVDRPVGRTVDRFAGGRDVVIRV
jgi:hypothetical protein